MLRRKKRSSALESAILQAIPSNAELLGLSFDLEAQTTGMLHSRYSVDLHAWFLDRVRASDPELSGYLHDGQSQKPFNLSALDGLLLEHRQKFQVTAGVRYRWHLNGFCSRLVAWLRSWVAGSPKEVQLNHLPFAIKNISVSLPGLTYEELLQNASDRDSSLLSLSFISPTSFRHKGHHLPLPVPTNVFHSYLRRWNHFSGIAIEPKPFLEWVDCNIIIHQAQIQTHTVDAGKSGSVTGFVGTVDYRVRMRALRDTDFLRLFHALGHFALYCGTGYKTTFGLGQTRSGLQAATPSVRIVSHNSLDDRIEELSKLFISQRKRTGGVRASQIATTQATILARREQGESLQAIAKDLDMPYETVKTYVKLARRSLRQEQSPS